ncbi:hypothetical protein CIPAW_14G108300 [Carya illinoinensis]|uniref:Uncharacterized protein n=1 Tax=Carya illinoinensis TaxID=32201 RepID=A0A8T1NDL1_CARIL|nr:hypothetical protein CIPAW_14G108300 [Carya illinoinensis]
MVWTILRNYPCPSTLLMEEPSFYESPTDALDIMVLIVAVPVHDQSLHPLAVVEPHTEVNLKSQPHTRTRVGGGVAALSPPYHKLEPIPRQPCTFFLSWNKSRSRCFLYQSEIRMALTILRNYPCPSILLKNGGTKLL